MYLNDFCTVPMSLAGIPAISIPCGLAAPPGGRPAAAGRLPARRAAVQRERACSGAAFALEQAIGFDAPRRRGERDERGALEPVIGLEIHVQLATRTKMFCGCELNFGEPPNTHTCPVCLGLPGALPVVNARAIHFGLMIGLALGCELAPRSIFHRKNYFYPDLPKGYQISQYDEPLCRGGALAGVRIHRVHLEEDAAKLIHVGESGRIHGSEPSVVDFNRGGTPLVEIVTEPDLRSPAQAREWLELLRATLRALGVSDVNMEEGSLRADANVSLRPAGSDALGTKTELKNMNSFRFLERGVAAEIERQRAILEGGGAVEQETLHFDPVERRDHLAALEGGGARLPLLPRARPRPDRDHRRRCSRRRAPRSAELPAARAERFERDSGSAPSAPACSRSAPSSATSSSAALAADAAPADARQLANWVGGELVGADRRAATRRRRALTPAALAALVALVAARALTATAAREVLDVLVAQGGDPAAIVAARGLGRSARRRTRSPAIVARAIAADPDAAAKVRAGNEKAIGALIGPVMRETRGRADGAEVTRLIREALGVAGELPSAGRAPHRSGPSERPDLGHAANDAAAPVIDHAGHEHTERPIPIPAPPAGGRGVHDGEGAGAPALQPCSPGSLRVTRAVRQQRPRHSRSPHRVAAPEGRKLRPYERSNETEPQTPPHAVARPPRARRAGAAGLRMAPAPPAVPRRDRGRDDHRGRRRDHRRDLGDPRPLLSASERRRHLCRRLPALGDRRRLHRRSARAARTSSGS